MQYIIDWFLVGLESRLAKRLTAREHNHFEVAGSNPIHQNYNQTRVQSE